MSILPRIVPRSEEEKRATLERELIRREARIGGKLFGKVPKGHYRQFFCLDEHTWIWHEEWKDKKGQKQAMTTRYYVRPTGVIKSQGTGPYQQLSEIEAHNLRKAAELYLVRITEDYQQMLGAPAR